MRWRAVAVGGLVVLSLINALVRLWGDWYTFFGVLAGQAIFLFGGIYPFLYHKTMLSFPGAVAVSFNPDRTDTETLWLRRLLVFAHTFFYALAFLVS